MFLVQIIWHDFFSDEKSRQECNVHGQINLQLLKAPFFDKNLKTFPNFYRQFLPSMNPSNGFIDDHFEINRVLSDYFSIWMIKF